VKIINFINNHIKLDIYLLVCISLILTLSSCNQEYSNNQTSRLFVSSVSNLNTQMPFHNVLVQKKDSLLKYDFWTKDTTIAKAEITKLENQETILFENHDTLEYIAPYYLYKDLLLFTHSAYVETTKGQKLKPKKFKSLVENKSYSTDITKLKTPNNAFNIRETISFKDQNITFLWKYFYKEKLIHSETEKVPYQCFEISDQLFIVPSTQDNPYPIYQVSKANKSQVDLTYFTDLKPQKKLYSLTDSISKKPAPNTYRLCLNGYQSLYYHGEEVRFRKGLAYLKNYLREDAPLAEQDGYINLHFTINCDGKVGRFGLELLDKKYKQTEFNPKLINHIVQKVKKLEQWNNLEKVSFLGAKDVKMFFLIKIRNQKIVDVCP